MELSQKFKMSALTLAVSTVLFACADNEEDYPNQNAEPETKTESEGDSMEGMDHSGMDMSGSGELPEGLEESRDPMFVVESSAIITASHMEGMKGAEATIVGAYDTTAYSISYDLTDGGERVEDHKWVIHEEIADAREEPYKEGDEVTVEASHIEGMDGVTAEINSAEETTVYMIDFTSTEGGEEVTNHKWVTESELTEVE